ncbi:L-pipecolate oxidase 2 [Colletotrichum sojae]|uniref:L-pipecolate oxidase 2 n=1 Tax=Colletotrichum sojae TaxID=2175907 RepID=A0A8H6J8X1_9PEZI|nr:L-pipecolate oxidase 2 [Colletotrichum sojae]
MDEPTVLIVGAGTFGTSTAYHLSQTYADPSRVTVIDRWATSSHGAKQAAAIDVNRIIRTDYASPLYCNLANEAMHPWFWSKELGHFFHKTGWVVLDEKDNDFSSSVRETFRQRGSDYTRDVDLHDVERKWGVIEGVKTDGLGRAYFNPEAGWCDAALATANYMAAAEKKGVKRTTGEVVELLLDRGGRRVSGVRVKDGQRLTADKIVLAAGAWTSYLLAPIEEALRIPEQDRIERQIKAVGRLSAYYTLSLQETESVCESQIPIIVYGGKSILTPPSRENRTLKINDLKTEFVNTVTLPSGQRISAPSSRNQEDVPEKLKRETEGLLSAMMPRFGRERKPDRWRICWDAKTPTGDWLMCKHPHSQLDNLHLAVGGNFSSYKFMPVAGKYMCNILKGRSNGAEKDAAWGWKSSEVLRNSQPKEMGHVPWSAQRPELRSYEGGSWSSKL